MLLNTATFPDSERVPKATFCLTQEFGDTPIDDALVSKNSKFKSDEEIIEVLNGCICCTVRKDLIKTLTNLGKRIQAGKLHRGPCAGRTDLPRRRRHPRVRTP